MSVSIGVIDDREAERRDEILGRLMQSILGTMDLAAIYIGDKLGLYRQILISGGMTSAGLAAATGSDERYVREWLEQQAASGILDADGADGGTRKYSLPQGHAEVLLDENSVNYLGAYPQLMHGILKTLPEVLDGFKTGRGLDYAALDGDVREGIARSNRPLHLNLLGREWLPSVPEVHDRLQRRPAARVADVGCGYGWSSVAIATAYPLVQVDGFDTDTVSIEHARANAAEAGLSDRVHFDTSGLSAAARGAYDLVLAIECIHDMAQPVAALHAMREMARPDGTVLVVDERVAETFLAPADDVERLFFGFSVLHCLPVGRDSTPSAMTGTVMRPATLGAYAVEAGFGRFEVLPIENDFWRFYRLSG
jgi:SAM-dependent methyltransferase